MDGRHYIMLSKRIWGIFWCVILGGICYVLRYSGPVRPRAPQQRAGRGPLHSPAGTASLDPAKSVVGLRNARGHASVMDEGKASDEIVCANESVMQVG